MRMISDRTVHLHFVGERSHDWARVSLQAQTTAVWVWVSLWAQMVVRLKYSLEWHLWFLFRVPVSLSHSMTKMHLLIGQWQNYWGPSNLWEKRFNEKLQSAQDEAHYLKPMQQETGEGQVYSVAWSFVSGVVEVFEVKFDEYAPAVRPSSTHYYEQV